jgi:hypothetical protein
MSRISTPISCPQAVVQFGKPRRALDAAEVLRGLHQIRRLQDLGVGHLLVQKQRVG